jgi:SPP1 gp7 family putative phage head morphogenesis protein
MARTRRRGLIRVRSPEPSLALAIHYERAIRTLLVEPAWRLIDEHVMPALRYELTGGRGDDLSAAIRASLAIMRERLQDAASESRLWASVEVVGRLEDRHHKAEFYRRITNAVGIKLSFSEPFFASTLHMWTHENVALIKSVRNAVRLEPDIEAAFSAGLRHEQLRNKWRKEGLPLHFGTLEGRTKVIARDQISKLNGRLTQMRQENLGIEKYTWRTNIDGRERDSHRENNGKVFRWDTPSERTGHPGHDVQCRCVAEGLIDIEALSRRSVFAEAAE